MPRRVFLCALLLAVAACSPPRPLTEADRQHVNQELDARQLPHPLTLVVDDSTGFVVATYQLTKMEVVARTPLKNFGQECLLAIREALLESGYKDYRVNVNGKPPGTGLVARYGAARFIDSGSVEWIVPKD